MIFSCLSVLYGQKAQIQGTVSDSVSQKPIIGANVILKGTLIGTATDHEGNYLIKNIKAGDYVIEILMIGYKKIERHIQLQAGDQLHFDFELTPQVLKTPEIMVTGAKRAMRKADSPVSITALSPLQIATRNPETIEDVLVFDSGVQIIDGQLNIRGNSGYTRGAGSRVAMLVDGVPAMAYDNGGIYWEAIPVDEIERVEVLKGPGSALYGSSAIGGVVNVITRNIPEGRATQVAVGGGFYSQPSYEKWRISETPSTIRQVKIAHRQRRGRLAGQFGVRYTKDDGYHQNDWYERWFLEGKIEYDWNTNRNLVSRLYYVDDVHGSFTQWRDAAHPFHTPLNTLKDRILSNKLQWSTQFRQVFSPRQALTIRSGYFTTWMQNKLYNNRTHSDAQTSSLECQLDIHPGNRHFITLGTDLRIHVVEANIWGSHHAYDAAIYFQDEMALLPRVQLTSGVRWDWHRTDSRTLEAQLNPKLGLVLRVSPLISLRASLGRAYRAPAIAEMFIDSRQYIFEVKPNPDLHSETSFSYELGAFYQSQSLMLDMALFHTDFDQLIDPVLDPSDNKIHFQNITDARITGCELNAEFDLPVVPGHHKIGYTYIYPENLTTKEQLSYRHNHSLVISTQFPITKQVLIGADYRYLSKINRVELFPENSVTGADKIVPIKLVSGYIHYEINPHLITNLSVENLLQYYYVVIERNMGATRSVRLNLEYTF
jgi:iron complex outermembrane receptor protein